MKKKFQKHPIRHGVYFFQCTVTKRVKIGRSINIDRRFADMRLLSPTKLIILTHISSNLNDSIRTESIMHRLFKKYRIHGEWFSSEILDTDRFQIIEGRIILEAMA